VTHLVIVPAPSAPAVFSAGPPLTPSGTPAASVGTASPAPVVVVDDPGPDRVEIAGLLVSVLASAVSIFLAWRAIQLARQANREASKARAAIATERRRTFELEVLRDLMEALDAEGLQTVRDFVKAPREMKYRFQGRVHLLPPEDLPTWRELMTLTTDHLTVARMLNMSDTAAQEWKDNARWVPSNALIKALRQALQQDVLAAITRRMEARDQ